MANMKFNQLMSKKYPPPFVPNNETLNCDPTYELEEMIVEVPFIYYVSIFLGFLDRPPKKIQQTAVFLLLFQSLKTVAFIAGKKI